MALYVFSCDNPKCDVGEEEIFMHMNEYHIPQCRKCGKEMRRIFKSVSFSFNFDFTPGYDTGLGEYCDTKRQRDNFVAQKNLRRVLS